MSLHAELRPVVWKDNVIDDGRVQKYREHPSRAERQYPVIWGQVERRAYTLLDSFSITVREFDIDDVLERIHVNRLIDGAWFDDPNELIGDRVVIDLRHLTGWVNQSGLQTEHDRHDDGSDHRFSVVTARTLPSLTVDHRGTSIRFTQSLGEVGDHIHELGISQRWTLRLVHPEPRLMSLFMDTASDIQDLVSIAVGKTADFEKVCIQHPSLPKLSLAGTPMGNLVREDITYHARWSNRSDPLASRSTGTRCTSPLDDLGGMDGVGRWLPSRREVPHRTVPRHGHPVQPDTCSSRTAS